MIRTAILAGIFLVLLSIAYSRPGALLENAQKVAAMVDEQPPVKAPVSAPVHKQPPQAHMAKVEAVAIAPPEAPVQPAPAAVATAVVVKEESAAVAVPAAPAVIAEAPRPAVAQPTSLLPPEPPHTQVAVTAPSSPALRAPAPLVRSADEPARAAAPALPSAEEMPLVNVPARPVVTPWEAPPRTQAAASNVAAGEPAVKQPDDAGPKLMTPQERSRELYRLAREMEDTFIRKLAR